MLYPQRVKPLSFYFCPKTVTSYLLCKVNIAPAGITCPKTVTSYLLCKVNIAPTGMTCTILKENTFKMLLPLFLCAGKIMYVLANEFHETLGVATSDQDHMTLPRIMGLSFME